MKKRRTERAEFPGTEGPAMGENVTVTPVSAPGPKVYRSKKTKDYSIYEDLAAPGDTPGEGTT